MMSHVIARLFLTYHNIASPYPGNFVGFQHRVGGLVIDLSEREVTCAADRNRESSLNTAAGTP